MLRCWIAICACLLIVAPGAASAADDLSGIVPPTAANLHTAESFYPPLSRALYEQGSVLLKFIVNTDGTVSNVQVEKSSGYPRLDAAAMDAASQTWRYHPATRDGKPIAVAHETVVAFHLRDASSTMANLVMKPTDFPPGAREKKESGVTAFIVYVIPGSGENHVELRHSSGYTDLDTAAAKREQQIKFGAASMDGKPVPSAVPVAIVWPIIQDNATK